MLLHRYTSNWYISLSLLQHISFILSEFCTPGDVEISCWSSSTLSWLWTSQKPCISEHSLWLHLHILICSTGVFLSLLQQNFKETLQTSLHTFCFVYHKFFLYHFIFFYNLYYQSIVVVAQRAAAASRAHATRINARAQISSHESHFSFHWIKAVKATNAVQMLYSISSLKLHSELLCDALVVHTDGTMHKAHVTITRPLTSRAGKNCLRMQKGREPWSSRSLWHVRIWWNRLRPRISVWPIVSQSLKLSISSEVSMQWLLSHRTFSLSLSLSLSHHLQSVSHC